MSNYEWVSILCVFCYTCLLMTFIPAHGNRIVRSFLGILLAMLLWTGGSYCMRLQLFPSVDFWFHVSILGLFILPYAFLLFIQEYVNQRKQSSNILWLIVLGGLYAFNVVTEKIIPPPNVERISDSLVRFAYDFDWKVAIAFVIFLMLILQMLYIIFITAKEDQHSRKQLVPIVLGMMILFLGHLFLLLPFFRGFPTDLVSGFLNALCMIYALSKRKLFRLQLLASRTSCYAITGVIVLFITYFTVKSLNFFVQGDGSSFSIKITMTFALAILIGSVVIYHLVKRFLNAIFVRGEQRKSENLKTFTHSVSKTLNVQEILEQLASVIQQSIKSTNVFICVIDNDGNYTMQHSAPPIGYSSFSLTNTHPILSFLEKNDGCISYRQFKRTQNYKSMWDTEKKLFNDWGIEYLLPLKAEDDLVGIVLLSGKDKREYSQEDIDFLVSIGSVSSIAVKNSKLYEKVFEEARRDELTGLFNRKCFFETLDTLVEENKNKSLALAILSIDDFTLYNQLYGAKEGDIALKKIAQIIESTLGTEGFAARYKGKVFSLIMPEYDIYRAKMTVEKICQQVKSINVTAENHRLKMLTLSAGICGIPYTASSAQELLHNAELSLYNAKRAGKNTIKIYSLSDENAKTDTKEKSNLYNSDAYSEYAPTIYALTAAIDTKDHYTFGHSKNVAYYATALAKGLHLDNDHIEIIREAGLLHDIGKIGIPENILNKPGKLTADEYEIMKNHVENSIGIIRHLPSLDYVIPAVIGHHEKYDGTGYPRRIGGEDIPLSARILCIADSFDAMISKRSYKQSMPQEKAIEILEAEAGKQFDPNLVPLFIDLLESGKVKVMKPELLSISGTNS
ncbi:HD domain-containing phosphohydrolase [Ohessyouella blattaphilus]|uniref:Diguanylate cyclase n=1 Tax=Ohessyouella blattaphilus TaxID=2949333 RepID=A0ABT1EJX8_9FIRM|nr:HD domain-containing phosphohydrolase [Ohessyouella blattaphilus]MCP1110779.1 diguanylate cyclase [Ohessyouella blattaphilus]MCR8564173.1 diguanylate cyclase [Ohessyouella blattaphilus]MDL2250040.1 diguanylate cyclase [Lachnospiraceae bacterium OttesenSCG-928-J05]